MPPSTARSSSRLSGKAAAKDSNDDHEEKPAPLQDSNKLKGGKTTTTTKAGPKKGAAATAAAAANKKESPNKRKQSAVKSSKNNNHGDDDDGASSAVSSSSLKGKAKKKKTTKTAAAAKTNTKTKNASSSSSSSSTSSDDEAKSKPSAKKTKANTTKAGAQNITERDELPKLWSDDKSKENGSYTLKVASWNVAGLRAVIKKDPEVLAKLVKKHDLDILCLQETKLQEMHLDDPKLKIRGHLLEPEGYDAYYSCSVNKKGYAGTAVFVKRREGATTTEKKKNDIGKYFAKKTDKEEKATSSNLPKGEKLLVPEKVSYGLGKEKHDGEGRVIVLDFPGFTMCNLYVPNSGQKLDRLSYRTSEWDKDLVAFIKEKQAMRGVPVMWLGDLNVAHKNLEAYNFGAKHLDKQAGLTPQERASFQEQLDSGFFDAFRHLHPEAKEHYTYWSQRAGNREPNKGLRLDYFVCDPSFFSEDSKVIARDSYMLPSQQGSDHCPVVLELEIKP